jgi:hypothetical protein
MENHEKDSKYAWGYRYEIQRSDDGSWRVRNVTTNRDVAVGLTFEDAQHLKKCLEFPLTHRMHEREEWPAEIDA